MVLRSGLESITDLSDSDSLQLQMTMDRLNKLMTTVERNDIQAKMQDVQHRLEQDSKAAFCANLAAAFGK